MDFLNFAAAHGLEITHLESGRIIRCQTTDHRSKKNGAYYFEHDWGWAMDWAVHDSPQIWQDVKDRSPVDQKEIQRKIKTSQEKYHQERARINQQAIKKAESILSLCRNDISAYLGRKGFPEMCFNMLHEDGKDPLLCVPMYVDGKLSGLQMIAPDGAKKFIFGTNANLATFDIGSNESKIFLCEGFCTGLSLQKILSMIKVSYKIRICFSAGNMAKVAQLHKDPILIGDNDESGTGQRVCIESGKRFYLPERTGDDLNDEVNKCGYLVVLQKIKKLLYKRLQLI